MIHRWVGIGAALLSLAVIFGAFGAHLLESRLDQYRMQIYEKSVFYHFIHGLAIVVVASMSPALLAPPLSIKLCQVFLIGILFFSGSLYALAITNVRWFGAITPLGGFAFILAWAMLALQMYRHG